MEKLEKISLVAKELNAFYFNRKVKTSYLPIRIKQADSKTLLAYHNHVRDNWDDLNVDEALNDYYEEDTWYLKQIYQSGVYFWLVDPDPLLTVNDIERIGNKYGVSVHDFQSWFASTDNAMKWLHSEAKDESFESVFSENYADKMYEVVWHVWDRGIM